MKGKKSSFSLEKKMDCLWLFLEKKRGEVVFSSQILRDLDWKSRGLLSRVVRDAKGETDKTIFLSVEGKLQAHLCAIDTLQSFDPEQFEKNVKGIKTEKLVVLFETPALREQIEKKMSKSKMSHAVSEVIFVEDQV